jgi:hypothetical protein
VVVSCLQRNHVVYEGKVESATTTGSCGRPLSTRGLACEPVACSVAQVVSWWWLGVDAWEGSLRRGFVACLERERKKEVEEATMTGGCGRLLSTGAVSLSSLSPLSLLSLSSLSLTHL